MTLSCFFLSGFSFKGIDNSDYKEGRSENSVEPSLKTVTKYWYDIKLYEQLLKLNIFRFRFPESFYWNI